MVLATSTVVVPGTAQNFIRITFFKKNPFTHPFLLRYLYTRSCTLFFCPFVYPFSCLIHSPPSAAAAAAAAAAHHHHRPPPPPQSSGKNIYLFIYFAKTIKDSARGLFLLASSFHRHTTMCLLQLTMFTMLRVSPSLLLLS